jgi:glutaredoxin-like protein NrdH
MTAMMDETAVGEYPKPVVYTKNDCPYCEQTKDKMNHLGVDYEVRNVSEDPDALKFVKSLKVRTMPLVYIDENTHWSGYKPELITEHFDHSDPWADDDDLWG